MARSVIFSPRQTLQFRTLAEIDLSGVTEPLGQVVWSSEVEPSLLATRAVVRTRFGCEPLQPAPRTWAAVFPGGLIRQVVAVGLRGVVVALQQLVGVAHQVAGMTRVRAARQVVAVGAENSITFEVVIQVVSEGVNCEFCSTNGLRWSWRHRS